MDSRIARIAQYRQSQPISELERKFRKIQHSRHRKNYWTVEEIDLAKAEARNMAEFFKPVNPD